MGYYMYLMKSKFKMKENSEEKALEALKELARKDIYLDWIYNEEIKNASTFNEAMRACRWEVVEQYDSICFNGEKYGSDDLIFNTIALYVEDDSYIQMQGEDGLIWRWIFKDGQCIERQATIVFN